MSNIQANKTNLFDRSGKGYVKVSDDYTITYMDTAKVLAIKNDLLRLANDYSEIISNLFSKFHFAPTDSKEWFGNQALVYFRSIYLDKINYIDFGNNLRNIVNKLDSDVSLILNNITKLNKLESEARYHDKI